MTKFLNWKCDIKIWQKFYILEKLVSWKCDMIILEKISEMKIWYSVFDNDVNTYIEF